jgi:hypothetical protein
VSNTTLLALPATFVNNGDGESMSFLVKRRKNRESRATDNAFTWRFFPLHLLPPSSILKQIFYFSSYALSLSHRFELQIN